MAVKVGGGLNFVTGPMGAGKSLYGTRRIVGALTTGRYVVTNVELMPDAFERIARHSNPLAGRQARNELARRLQGFYVFETDLAEAVNYRLPGKGEGRGIFVWDEGHNDLNNRSWKTDGREELLRWATQLRKLGFVGYLLTQHGDNTDAALRRVANFHVRLQNQKENTRVFGMRVSPWPLFLAFWYPANGGQTGVRAKPMRVERYFLGWHRHLYDTHGLYHGLVQGGEEDTSVVLLPAGGRPRPRVIAARDAGRTPPELGQSGALELSQVTPVLPAVDVSPGVALTPAVDRAQTPMPGRIEAILTENHKTEGTRARLTRSEGSTRPRGRRNSPARRETSSDGPVRLAPTNSETALQKRSRSHNPNGGSDAANSSKVKRSERTPGEG